MVVSFIATLAQRDVVSEVKNSGSRFLRFGERIFKTFFKVETIGNNQRCRRK